MVQTTIVLFLITTVAAFHPKIDKSLHRGLREGTAGDVMIVLKKKTTTRRRLEALHPRDRNRGGKIQSRVNQMAREAADNSQSVLSVLEAAKTRNPRSVFQSRQQANDTATTYNSHWITNSISVKGASEDVLKTLAELDDVELIRAPKVIPMAKPIKRAQPESLTSASTKSTDPIFDEAIRRVRNSENQWGIEKIEAPRTWESFNRGEGVVIASIDTGVRGTSMFLKDAYVGAENFGWYDPYMKASEPTDYDVDFGHGTHTMGTMVGSNGIGVAPGAKWMACTACDHNACYEEELIACAEFMACPHDTTGNNADCSKAPFIINNSWGGPGGDSFYQDVVDIWRSFGIIPVFANGNTGPSCGITDSPGDYANVIAVESTTVNDAISEFSSKGPGPNGLVKPDISASGEDILSASSVADDCVAMLSGSDTASPHVAGMIALMLSADDTRGFDDIFTSISSSSETNTLISSGMTCGGTSDTTFPNNIFGHSRINAYHTLAGQTVPVPAPESTPTPAPEDVPAPITPDFNYSDKVDDALKENTGERKELVIHFTSGVSGLPMVNRGNSKARIDELNAKGAELYKAVFEVVEQYKDDQVTFEYQYIGPALRVHNAPAKLIYELGELSDVRKVYQASPTPVSRRSRVIK